MVQITLHNTCKQFSEDPEFWELESEQQLKIRKNEHIIKLRIHLLSNQKPMTKEMFRKSSNGSFVNHINPSIRSLVPRPQHFGPIKFYVNGHLDRKWRYKYWELWFVETGEQTVEFEYDAKTEHQSFEKLRKRYFDDKMRYLRNYRNKELQKKKFRQTTQSMNAGYESRESSMSMDVI